MHECDDGNLIDGDGCSSACKKEDGFRCTSQPNGPDICKDIVPPTATLKITKGNTIMIVFNEKVSLSATSIISIIGIEKELKELIIVTLETNTGSQIFEWDFDKNVDLSELINSITIIPIIPFNLKGTEKWNIQFNDDLNILDSSDNQMKIREYMVSSLRYYNSSSTTTAAGDIFSISSYIALIMGVGLSPFKSNPAFWIFINMIQIISYIPVINCLLPEDVEVFLIEYFGVSKVSIPFDSLPKWVPDPRVLKKNLKQNLLIIDFIMLDILP